MSESVNEQYDKCLRPMFEMLYEKLLADLNDKESIIWKHHIEFANTRRRYYGANTDYQDENSVDDIVVDSSGELISPEVIESSFNIPECKRVAYVKHNDKNCLILEFNDRTPNIKKRAAFKKALQQKLQCFHIHHTAAQRAN